MPAYKAADLKEGYILTALNYLEWRRNADRGFVPFKAQEGRLGLTEDTFLTALNTLKSRFASEPVTAEVYLAQARYAIQKQQQVNALQLCDGRDSPLSELSQDKCAEESSGRYFSTLLECRGGKTGFPE